MSDIFKSNTNVGQGENIFLLLFVFLLNDLTANTKK